MIKPRDKFVVVKYGLPIHFKEDNRGAVSEARIIAEMLSCNLENEVVIITKTSVNGNHPVPDYVTRYIDQVEYMESETLEEEFKDHILVIVNGLNPPSDKWTEFDLINEAIIESWPTPPVYLLCDPQLYKRPNIYTNRTDIKVITQAFDVNAVREYINNVYWQMSFNGDLIPQGINFEIPETNIAHFPMNKFPMLRPAKPVNLKPEYDLIYGGSMRSMNRIHKMGKYLGSTTQNDKTLIFGRDINKEAFIENGYEANFDIGGPIDYDKFVDKYNTSISTIIIGDELYERFKNVPQRFYESIQAGILPFIDRDLIEGFESKLFAPNRAEDVNNMAVVERFLDVNDSGQLWARIKPFKWASAYREMSINMMQKIFAIDPDKYKRDFANLVVKMSKSQ